MKASVSFSKLGGTLKSLPAFLFLINFPNPPFQLSPSTSSLSVSNDQNVGVSDPKLTTKVSISARLR
jgi:hypothetical protein